VLARETTLKDIKSIATAIKKEKVPCHIETFVHGAMCVSISGRCFLSHDAFSKSANRGECYQPCRREFRIKDIDEESEYIVGKDYILSPRDLCTIDIIDKLIECNIDAFKIEGRNRSPEYVSIVVACYRKAIDAYAKGKLTKALKSSLKKELARVYNRGFEKGFYLGKPDMLGGVIEKQHEKIYIGQIKKFYKKIGVAELLILSHSLKAGDTILVSGKNTPASFAMVQELQVDHKPIKHALKGAKVGIKLPFSVHLNDKVFLYVNRR